MATRARKMEASSIDPRCFSSSLSRQQSAFNVNSTPAQNCDHYCATFNVGNKPINDTFYTELLKKSEDCDVIVVAAQEASYAYSRKITQPADFARLAEKRVENDSIVNKKEKNVLAVF